MLPRIKHSDNFSEHTANDFKYKMWTLEEGENNDLGVIGAFKAFNNDINPHSKRIIIITKIILLFTSIIYYNNSTSYSFLLYNIIYILYVFLIYFII